MPLAARSPRWGWLLLSFTRREIIGRYAGSVSGLAWTLLHPLIQLAVLSVVNKPKPINANVSRLQTPQLPTTASTTQKIGLFP